MGIYPTYRKTLETRDGDRVTWTEFRELPGVTWRREVSATRWVEHERTDCFCCSCPADGTDFYCRNHGAGRGSRPCVVHRMPGQLDDDGHMPESVQKYRVRVDGAAR